MHAKKQCPHNEGVECAEEECKCCGWNPKGRTKKREPKKRTYTRHISPKKDSETKDKRKRQTNNTSGHTGVYWNGRRGKWSAEIRVAAGDFIEEIMATANEAIASSLAEIQGARASIKSVTGKIETAEEE